MQMKNMNFVRSQRKQKRRQGKKMKEKLRKNYIYREILSPIWHRCTGMRVRAKDRRKFNSDMKKYISMYQGGTFELNKQNNFKCLTDWRAQAGTLGGYFWQDLWAARHIAEKNPSAHYDIGSSVASFIGHLASFRDNIYLIDVRPLEQTIPGVHFRQADATNLAEIEDNSIESLSALCSLEHFGLGRYSDPIDPEAWRYAMKSIQRVLAPGGFAYISVPIGKEHLVFNAHRIFYASTIVETFDELELVEFACETNNQLEIVTDIHKYDNDDRGRFGMFMFQKNRHGTM